MTRPTKKYRVKRHRWTKDGKVKTEIIHVPEKGYEILDRRIPPRGYGNHWFTDHPYKWYEFHDLRSFLGRLKTKMKKLTSAEIIKNSPILDTFIKVVIAVSATIIAYYIMKFHLNWI